MVLLARYMCNSGRRSLVAGCSAIARNEAARAAGVPRSLSPSLLRKKASLNAGAATVVARVKVRGEGENDGPRGNGVGDKVGDEGTLEGLFA